MVGLLVAGLVDQLVVVLPIELYDLVLQILGVIVHVPVGLAHALHLLIHVLDSLDGLVDLPL